MKIAYEESACCYAKTFDFGRLTDQGFQRMDHDHCLDDGTDWFAKQLRYMPMARAHGLARKLQGRFGTTVSVI